MDPNIIIFTIIAFLIGVILTYIILKATTVNRKDYNAVREEINKANSIIEAKAILEAEQKQRLEIQTAQLESEQSKVRDLEKEVTELRTTAEHAHVRYNEEKEMTVALRNDIKQKEEVILELRSLSAQLKVVNTTLKEKLEEQNEAFDEQRKKSLVEFENIANKLFEEKTNQFNITSKKNIEQLLNPLRENINEFKKKVEETYDKESKQRFSLEDKIKELVNLNQQISQDATNLTNALKGQAKTQGDWGEMILENILEQSGLIKDREYFTQSAYKDENGRSKQPDVRIRYPDERYVIVDAKVSLTAYERYVNSEDQDEQGLHLSQHLLSVKNHIDNLASKEYDQFNKGLDFVFLFIPIEPAFLTAIHYDQNLWQYAYKKRIVLMSPTNLIATLKLIGDIWKREHQNRNAQEIAERGSRLYEKFVGFIRDMEDIGEHLDKTQDKYNKAFGKLSKGSGNLIGQVEKLRKLGLQSKKTIDEHYLTDNPELDAGKDEPTPFANDNPPDELKKSNK